MDLEALKLFVAVAREGSIQGASKSGAGSRTTVRRKLDELEDAIGVPLFDKGHGGVDLTEAGEVLYTRAAILMAEAEVLAQTTREVGLNLRRPLRLFLPIGAPPDGVLFVFKLLRTIWPDAQMEAISHCDDSAPDPREADLFVTMRAQGSTPGFRMFRLSDIEVQLIATPEYLSDHPPIESVEDLSKHTVLAWHEPRTEFEATLPSLSGEPVPFRPDFVSDDVHQLHELAASGLGVALVPHRNMPPGDAFVRVLADEIGQPRVLRLLVARSVEDSPMVRGLTDFLDQFLNPEEEE